MIAWNQYSKETPQEQPDSQAGDEQTETDEPIWLDVHDFTEQQVKRILKWHNETRERYARQQTAQVLERLHRTDGEGLPKRDYDNVTDEAIDAELAALRVGLEGK